MKKVAIQEMRVPFRLAEASAWHSLPARELKTKGWKTMPLILPTVLIHVDEFICIEHC